jgi:hypothetical protein
VAFACIINFCLNIYYGTLYAYTPEVLPSAHRGTGNGIAIGWNRIMGIMSAVIATVADVSFDISFSLSRNRVRVTNRGIDQHARADLYLCGAVYLHGGDCCGFSVRALWETELLKDAGSFVMYMLLSRKICYACGARDWTT